MGRKKKKGKSSKKKNAPSGGSMMRMRSGIKSAVGQGSKKRRAKSQLDFMQVLGTGVAIALAVVVLWQFTR